MKKNKKEKNNHSYSKAHRNVPTKTLVLIHQTLDKQLMTIYNLMDSQFQYNETSTVSEEMFDQMKKLFLAVNQSNLLGKNFLNRQVRFTLNSYKGYMVNYADIDKLLSSDNPSLINDKNRRFILAVFLGAINWIVVYSKKLHLKMELNSPLSNGLEEIYKSAEFVQEICWKSLK